MLHFLWSHVLNRTFEKTKLNQNATARDFLAVVRITHHILQPVSEGKGKGETMGVTNYLSLTVPSVSARHGQAEIWLLLPDKVSSPAVAWGHCHAASSSWQSGIASLAAVRWSLPVSAHQTTLISHLLFVKLVPHQRVAKYTGQRWLDTIFVMKCATSFLHLILGPQLYKQRLHGAGVQIHLS